MANRWTDRRTDPPDDVRNNASPEPRLYRDGRPLQRPQGVIFDCDAVLIDSEPITNGVLSEMLNDLGLDFASTGPFRTFMGKSVKDELTAIEAMIGRPLPADWHPQFVVRRDAALAVRMREMPGVRAVVQRPAALSIPYAVASRADCAEMCLTPGTCGAAVFLRADG